MLSLKDFKKYEVKVDRLKEITGGIACDQLDATISIVEEQNGAQAQEIWNQLATGGIQCTRGNNILNITVRNGVASYVVVA